jgi:hypothetical protein
MSLRDACAAIVQNGDFDRMRLPEHPRLAKVAAQLAMMPSMESGHRPKGLKAVASEIAAAIRANAALSRRQVRQAPWCLWASDTNLAKERDLLTAILESIARAERPSPFRALAAEFVDKFAPNLLGIDLAAPCLQLLAGRWGGEWGRLHGDMAIFDPVAGPQGLGVAVVRQDRSVTEILRDYGLGAMSANGGYAQAVTAQILNTLAQGGDQDHLRRLGKVKRFALTPDGRALFASQKPQIAEALLRPLLTMNASKAVTEPILEAVLDLLGDPRLNRSRANWIAVASTLKELVIGWLTEQSLRQFLDIVDQTAVEHMWRYRRAFWQSVYDTGLISAAWVAFGIDGCRIASSGAYKGLKFAELYTDGRQVESGHAVLLMQIGNGLIADWSHNAKCNIWYDAADPKAPSLFRDTYGSKAVRIGDNAENRLANGRVSLSHTSSETFGWQRKVADHITHMTGQRLDPRQWRPR